MEIPFIGGLLAIHKGQPYYYLSQGDRGGVIKFSSLHNKFAMRNYFTFDFPVANFTVRAGYLNSMYRTDVNGVKTHVLSNSFMIGLVQYKEYVSVPYGWLAYLCLYYGDTYNAERQSVALGVAFLAFSFAWKKKYHWAVLLLAVSCLFHNATFISFGALLIYILLQHFDNWWVKGGLAVFS